MKEAEKELENQLTETAIVVGSKRMAEILLRAAKNFGKQKPCRVCGFTRIPVGGNGEKWGYIDCCCKNPKLKKLLAESPELNDV